jgi:epsilon-lactone hydrolase
MPSVTSRAVAAVLPLTGLKGRVLNPAQFAGPSAKPRKPGAHRPPKSVARHVAIATREVEGWPVYAVTPQAGGAEGGILYLHGGGYVKEILPATWRFIGRLAENTGRTVTVPIYPLAPEHTYRDVFPTLLTVYEQAAAGQDADRFAVIGDSAGAGMALALVQSLPDTSARCGDLILLSPWLDATMTNPGIAAVDRRDLALNTEHLKALGIMYARPDPPSVPQVSPINGPMGDLGRVTLFTGTRDVLNPDARRLRELAAAAGVDIAFREYEGMLHNWMLAPVLPEARAVLKEIAAALSRNGAPAS